jgi:hypothetical protein
VGNTADLQKMLRSANTKMIEDMGKEDTDAK